MSPYLVTLVIHTGLIQSLTILRSTSVGLFLGDADGNEVLLPNKYCPEHYEQGLKLEVFVYRDSEDRQVATTLHPKIELDSFALLRVNMVGMAGAFLDWGMEKDLLVPYKEQRGKMEAGRWYVVHMALDEQTDRLFGSSRIDRYLNNEQLTVAEGDAVDLLVYGRSDMGWSVIVNGKHQGLVHESDVFKPLSVGDNITGHVRKVRPDNKLDIALQPIGYSHYNDGNMTLLLRRLKGHGGFLPFTDKSSPEEIQQAFGLSKKAFKKALGALYKARQVKLDEQGITWLENDGPPDAGTAPHLPSKPPR